MESFNFMKRYLEITDDLDCLNAERRSQHGEIRDCIRELMDLRDHPAANLYQQAVISIELTKRADFTPRTPFIERHALEVFHLCRQMAEEEPESAENGTLCDVIQDLHVKAARALRDLEQTVHNCSRRLPQYEHWDIRTELRRDFDLSPADCGLPPDEYDEEQYSQGTEGEGEDDDSEEREEQEEEQREVDVEEFEETASSDHASESGGDALEYAAEFPFQDEELSFRPLKRSRFE